MAKIKFSISEFEKEIKITEEIKEKLSLFGTTFESLDNKEIELEISANRPDLFSLQGFLRSFNCFLNKDSKLKEYKIYEDKNLKVNIKPSVKNVRPYTSCAVIKDLSLTEEKIKEIMNLQEKLHSTIGRNRKRFAIGIYPLEKIKMPIDYTALNPSEIKFIPLGETKVMTALQILQKHPTGIENSELLKDKDKFPIFIDSAKNILSMPPIINSELVGRVTTKTKEVFIECSGDSEEINETIVNIVSTCLADMGGKIYSIKLSGEKIKTTPKLEPKKLPLSLQKTNKVLGTNITEKDLPKLLKKMGHDYKNNVALISPWRIDIINEIDIIEDIAIAYGYENFIPELPKIATFGEETKESKFISKLTETLIGMALIETSSHHLLTEKDIELSNTPKPIYVENSKTEFKALRNNIYTSILRTLSNNTDKEYPQNIFEIGKVFSFNSESETGIKEKTHLAISLAPGNFTNIKQIFDSISNSFDIRLSLTESENKLLISGRTGEIMFNNKPIGFLGEVHPNTLNNWNIKMPISILEINLEEIINSIYPK